MLRNAITCLTFALLLAVPSASAGPAAPAVAETPKPRPVQVAGSETEAPDRIARVVQRFNHGGQTTAALVDIATGEVLSAHQADIAMPPASVTKIVTTLYGFSRLGREHQFRTEILATGRVEAGIVQGDLILAGRGDPSLDSDELAQMIKTLRDKNIKGITGDYLFYDAALPRLREIEEGQPADAGYNPGVAGLNLNFNRVFFEWEKKGQDLNLSLEARANGHSPSVSSSRITATDHQSPIFRYSEKGGADHWSVARAALRKNGGVWLPVRDPGLYAADVFRSLAKTYGIALPAPKRMSAAPDAVIVLAEYVRRPLHEVSRGMLHYSTNVTAEVIGLSATATLTQPANLEASARAMEAWAQRRFDAPSAHFRDHSGLGDDNRISASDMAAIVAKAAKDGALDGVLRQYFVPKPGSRSPAVKGAEVRAKTGTLNFVRGLSGVIEGANGRKLAFAIFTSDLEARAKADNSVSRPPGARRFANRARELERAVLAEWMLTYAR